MFSVKGPRINMLGLVGPPASAIAPELCSCSLKTAKDNTLMNGHRCISIKLYLWTPKFDFHTISQATKIIFFLFPSTI